MKKLLHERLREWATNEEILAPIEMIALFEADKTAAKDAFLTIADEIERYYIPLPCDPDGKPWKIGDEFETLNVHPRCEGYLLFEGEWYLRSQHSQEFKASGCKRPSPKVLDADGVEIKVGDTVWLINDSHALIVDEIKKNSVRATSEVCSSLWYDPKKLTHKEPDSLEKLLEYLEGKYNLCSYEMDEVRDRISALIEKAD